MIPLLINTIISSKVSKMILQVVALHELILYILHRHMVIHQLVLNSLIVIVKKLSHHRLFGHHHRLILCRLIIHKVALNIVNLNKLTMIYDIHVIFYFLAVIMSNQDCDCCENCEKCTYCFECKNTKNCMQCVRCKKSEHLTNCGDCKKCYNCESC